MKRVYLIRHALPDFPDGRRRCLGRTDIPLGDASLAQAEAMAASLPTVTAVFSSPLTRAVQTARTISQEITILDGLRELDYGQWDGLTFGQIRQRFPELYAARADDKSRMPPGSEAPEQGLARFSAAMEEAARVSPGDFAVVTHGGITELFLRGITGRRYKPRYCEVISLIWENERFLQSEEIL